MQDNALGFLSKETFSSMEKPFEIRRVIALFQRVFSLFAVQNLAHHVMGWGWCCTMLFAYSVQLSDTTIPSGVTFLSKISPATK